MGGTNVSDPVQTSRCSDSYTTSPHRTLFLSIMNASPFITSTPACANLDLMPSTNLRTTFDLRATIFPKSKEAVPNSTPYLDACRPESYSFAEYNNVFVGIHPSFKHTPPKLRFSNNRTCKPPAASFSAAVYPAGPPPIIITSYFIDYKIYD